MAGIDVTKWLPVEYGGTLIKPFSETSVLLRVSEGPGGRRETMTTRVKHVPKDTDVDVQFTAKGQAYGLDDSEADEIELVAKKMTAAIALDEEDVSDASSFVKVVPTKREAAFRAFATLLDNAAFAVTGAPTTEPNMAVPYNSLYRQVSEDAPDNKVTWDRSGGTAADLRESVLETIGLAEESDWATDDLVVLANPAFRAYLRNQPIDGANGLPIWSTAENTILTYPVLWGRGLRTSAVASQKPASGNPLMIVGPRSLIIPGIRDNLSWRVTDSETGIGALSDTMYILARQRLGFNIGEASAFGILELVP